MQLTQLALDIVFQVLAASDALACTVCGGGGREESKTAFLITTALMSSVPLASIGGLVYFLHRRTTRDKD